MNNARVDRGESGFTLIELLVVVLILGILTAIVLFAVGGFSGTTAEQACKTDVEQVQSAVDAYYTQNGRTWPTTIAQLSPTYLQQVPSSNEYTIALGASGTVTGTMSAANGGGTCYS